MFCTCQNPDSSRSRYEYFVSGAIPPKCLTIARTGGGIMAKKILVVENDEDSQAILSINLQRFCGYETIEAGTGTETIQKAVVEGTDLIVMDLGLPDITGVEVAKALKENPNTAQIPIMARTAW